MQMIMKYLLLFSVLMSATYCSDKFNDAIKFLKAGSYEAPFEVTFDGVTYYNETYEYGPDFMEEYWTALDVMSGIYRDLNSFHTLYIHRVICNKTIGDADVYLCFNSFSLSPLLNKRFKLSDRSRFSTSDKDFDYYNIDGWMEINNCKYLEYGTYQISGEFSSSAVCSEIKDTVQVVGHFTDTRIFDRDEILKDYQ